MCSSFPGLLIGRTAVHSGKDPAFVAYDQFLSTGILQPLSRGEVRCGSFTSLPPYPRVRFAPRADIRSMPAFISTRPNQSGPRYLTSAGSRPPTILSALSGARRTSASDCGCPAVKDITLVAWYRSLYAPRTGGAYDSHHRTTKILSRTRRRGCGVAARGTRAASSDAGDWAAPTRLAGGARKSSGGFPQGTERERLHRGPKLGHRIPVGA